MKRLRALAAALTLSAALVGGGGNAHGSVLLTFEDIDPAAGDLIGSATGPNNLILYKGLGFGPVDTSGGFFSIRRNFHVFDNRSLPGGDRTLPWGATVPWADSGYRHGQTTPGGTHIVFNGGGFEAQITSYGVIGRFDVINPLPLFGSGPPTFTWESAQLTASWADALDLDITAYGATHVPALGRWMLDRSNPRTAHLQLSRSTPLSFQPGWTGVAALVFRTSYTDPATGQAFAADGTQFVMDDFRFTLGAPPAGGGGSTSAASSVPEPHTAALLASFLLAGGLGRRARSSP